jgi:hypothetical protein
VVVSSKNRYLRNLSGEAHVGLRLKQEHHYADLAKWRRHHEGPSSRRECIKIRFGNLGMSFFFFSANAIPEKTTTR